MTTTATRTAYAELCEVARETATLLSAEFLLAWDQETYMPEGAADARASQRALIAGLVHDRKTSERMGELIAACEADAELTADPATKADIREFRRDYDLATKLPVELVRELTEVGSRAQNIWRKAREQSDFSVFRPILERLVGLVRQKAECYGTPKGGELYDALLNEYEPGARAADIESIFTPLAERLSALVANLADNGTPPDTSCLDLKIPEANQHSFGMFILESIGFDLSCGRLDTTTHPFCEGLAPGDTRLTTRYRDERFTDALYGTMHEAGHGIYEQGLPKARCFGQPLGEAISLGIHESQSRMWENSVGRSRAFWTWALPHAKDKLGPAIAPCSADDLYRAVNTAQPSFIRVEADEATYNLHIMLRFDIERAIIRGDVAIKDIPGLWNETFKRYLGLGVPDDRRGCLQDVHWSFGAIGYFPTYCLGNLYAAQLWETINEQIPDLNDQIARGEFAPLRTWLNQNIHAQGRRYRAGELCERLTGKPLSADPLLRHLEGKLKPIYGLA
ncbi:MAG: carboxypeptidase M32 [Planctomycetes bacterium]|nr:carboxypeptidase M32 [Planctomycetota bacterium]